MKGSGMSRVWDTCRTLFLSLRALHGSTWRIPNCRTLYCSERQICTL